MKKKSVNDDALRPRFWEKYQLEDLSRAEWEALCDGCGKCCLIKLEDEDTREVAYTNIACRLLDRDTCRCGNYPLRRQLVRGCVFLDRNTIEDALDWMPHSCAYRLIDQGKKLADWHPLISGDPMSVHEAGISLKGRMVAEFDVDEDDWPEHIIEEDI